MPAPAKVENKRTTKLTPRAVILGVVALGTVAFGIFLGEQAMIEIGIFVLLGILALRWLAIQNLKGLHVSRRLPLQVFAGSDIPLDIIVESKRKWGTHFGLQVEDLILPKFLINGADISALAAGEGITTELTARILRRGKMKSVPIALRSFFPLGLYRSEWSRMVPVVCTVFPRPVRPDAVHALEAPDQWFDSGDDSVFSDPTGSFRSIREFRPGDSLKSIHWPSSARFGSLLVRENDRPTPRQFAIVHHSYQSEGTVHWREAFDHALSLLTGLILYAHGRGIPFTLTASFLDWKTLSLTVKQPLATLLTHIAVAHRRVSSNARELTDKIRKLPGQDAIIVISETPLREWAHLIPPLPRIVLCLDTKEMRIHPLQRGRISSKM